MTVDYNVLINFKRRWENTDRDDIAIELRRIQKVYRLKGKDLADIMGMSVHTVYAYTKKRWNTIKPDPYALLLLATYLNIDPSKLLRGWKTQ